MKIQRSFACALACLALAACGGGGAPSTPASPAATSALISGTISGLPSAYTLLLKNQGVENIAITANARFSFAKRVSEGATYNVSVFGQPSGRSCTVANGTGTVAHGVDNISNLVVSCSEVAVAFIHFQVGVTVSGLSAGNSIVFSNNGTDALSVSENGLFVFENSYFIETIYSGRSGGYEVTLKMGPANQTCTISNGAGSVTPPGPINNFVNVLVICK